MELQTVLSPPARHATRPLAGSFAGDERLARLVAQGDESAFRLIYERYHQPLHRYCRSLLRNEADAQDALQSAFVSALGALRRAQRDAPLRPWLFRIAHNESISLLRRRRPEQELSNLAEDGTIPLEEQVEGRERFALLMADLRELPERQRAALIMRELSGLSHEEIGLALDASVGATKQSIFEARRSLMEFSEGRAMPCDEVRKRISDADGRVLRSRRLRAHLRHCPGCAAFAAAIPERSRALRALTPPLPPLAAAGIFARAVGGGSVHGGDTAGYLAAGGGKALGTGFALKATAMTVAAVTAAVGAGVALRHATPTRHPGRPGPALHGPQAPGAGAGQSLGTGSAVTGRLSAPAGARRLVTPQRLRGVALLRGAGGGMSGAGTAAVPGSAHASSSAVASAGGTTAGPAGAASHPARGSSPSRGLGPPAYPGQRSRSSPHRSSSSHRTGSTTSPEHGNAEAPGLARRPSQPPPAHPSASPAPGSFRVTPALGEAVPPAWARPPGRAAVTR